MNISRMALTNIAKSIAGWVYPNRYPAYAGPSTMLTSPMIHAMFSSSVRTGVRVLATLVSQVQFTSDVRWVREILRRPNPWQHRQAFLNAVATDLTECGYAVIDAPRAGVANKRKGMVPINAREVTIEARAGQPYIMPYGAMVDIDPNETQLILDNSRSDGTSFSRVEDAAGRVALLTAIDGRSATISKSSLTASYVVTRASRFKNAGDDTAQEIQDKPVLALEEGSKLEAVAPPPLLDTPTYNYRESLKREIAAALLLPAEVLGVSGSEKYSNAALRQVVLHTMAVHPMVMNIRLSLEDLLGVPLGLDMSDVFAGDLATDINAMGAGVDRALFTPREARRYFDYLPLDNSIIEDSVLDELSARGSTRTDTDASGSRRGENATENPGSAE